jgi:hypothetical protein
MKWILFYIFIIIFVVTVALTVAKVFFGFGEPSEAERKVLFSVFIGEVGIAVLALFKMLFGLKKRPKEQEETPLPKINGKYKFEMTGSDSKIRCQGECLVKQDGRVLNFNGVQKKARIKRKKEKVSVRWYSNWAELCEDNKVRVDYSITLNGGIRGYAILDTGRKTGKEMMGEFHMLHEPYTYGTVKFKRV